MENEPQGPFGAGQPGEIPLTDEERAELLAELYAADLSLEQDMDDAIERANHRHAESTEDDGKDDPLWP